jgi:cysteine-rich repeat protein
VGAEVRIEHPCARGSVTTCNTTELSEPGAMIEVVRIAADREAIRIRIRPLRAVGAPDDVAGARVSFEIELVPADPPPASLPMLCTAAAHECAAERSVSYCSDDGTYERTAPCFDPEELDAVVCSAGNCELPNGESCGTAVPIVRPASDVVSFEAHVRGLYDDLDPGSQCFGMGMSGADKVYRIDLDAGDRIRAEMISEDPAHLTHSLYLLSDCADPAAGCLTGSIGHRTSIGDGFTRRFRPSLSYVAPRHETVFLVVDLENRSDERDTYRQLTVRWDGTCSDGVRNGDETGIDCGGPCGPCPDAMGCVSDADCESRRCGETTRWICGRPAGCGDAVFGAGEECDDGNAIDDDWCSSGCLAARCDDGVQNGDETGVDLGGYCAMSEADVCRRAPILMLPYNFGLGTLESALLESDFTGAADDFSPSCAPGPGVDHVYRIWFERGERIDFSVLATVGTPPLTIAIAPECGAAELACATGAGFALIDRVFEPGWYLVWVEQRGGAGPYELSIAPR